MYLESLALNHFRNITDQSIEFSRGFNYFYGANGAGKTAILESVFLLARGRSFRTQKTQPIVQSGHSELVARARVSTEGGVGHQVALAKTVSGETRMRRNGQKESRASMLAKLMPVQTLLPDAGDLVLKGPAQRRAFLDWGLFHVEQPFLELSRQYRRVLAQRNAWLKTQGLTETSYVEDPWFNQYATLAMQLSQLRQAYLKKLQPCFEKLLKQLAPELDISLDYNWGGLVCAEDGLKKMSESFPRDVKFGSTHRGPHRGDLIFMMSGANAAETVSRGQAKLIASAAILSQAKLLYELCEIKSIFLIDDFGAELDGEHWKLFLETLLELECQVIATSTEALRPGEQWVEELVNLELFHVEHGQIRRVQQIERQKD